MRDMYQKVYFVPKRSGTLADPLLAYGTATVLRALIETAPGRRVGRLARVIIEDSGAHYTIQLSEAIREDWLADARLPADMAKALLNTAK